MKQIAWKMKSFVAATNECRHVADLRFGDACVCFMKLAKGERPYFLNSIFRLVDAVNLEGISCTVDQHHLCR